MAAHRILLALCLGTCWSAGCGKPSSIPTNLPAECQAPATLVCIPPVTAIAMSPEGQQLSQPGAKFSQIVTESFYNNICSTVQTFASCFANYWTRCSPPEFEALADTQFLSRGVTKILFMCNETDSYSKFAKLASCADKIKIPFDTCGRAEKASVSKSERQLRPGAVTENDAILYFRNRNKEICCDVKTFKDCIAPGLQSSCTAEEKTLAENFGDRVLRAFECTDAVYQTCFISHNQLTVAT